MSTTENSDTQSNPPVLEGGVLAALPRARPQRVSARRAAARGKAAKSETAAAKDSAKRPKKAKTATTPTPTTKAKARAKPTTTANAKPTTKTKAKTLTKLPAKTKAETRGAAARGGHAKQKPSPSLPSEPAVPRQGYEPEEELEIGNSVHPPSGVELLESLSDIVSELAGSGLTAGGRLLKDACSILRRP